MTLKVPIRLIVTVRVNVSSGITPALLRTRAGGPIPAQFTTTRSSPRPSATSRAAATCSESVTSAGANVALPRSAAACSPPDEGRSSNTTLAPAFMSRRAVANPSPEAPPVITATPPAMSTRPTPLSHRCPFPASPALPTVPGAAGFTAKPAARRYCPHVRRCTICRRDQLSEPKIQTGFYRRSMMVALAIPPPSHMVCRPYLPPVASR